MSGNAAKTVFELSVAERQKKFAIFSTVSPGLEFCMAFPIYEVMPSTSSR